MNDLLAQLSHFNLNSTSTSTTSNIENAQKNASFQMVDLEFLLPCLGVQSLLPRLTTRQYYTYKKKVTNRIILNGSEREGIHPFVHQILCACLQHTKSRKIVVEREIRLDNEQNTFKIPDFSVFETRSRWDRFIASLLLPVEVKYPSDNALIAALIQAAGYQTQKLRYCLEIHRDYLKDMHSVALGTDGNTLVLGLVLIREGKLSLLATRLALWDEDVESDGLRLLRTLFSLTPAALGHTPPSHTLHTPTSTYNLSRVLGRGGSSAVFAATGTRRQPAIKLRALGAGTDGQLEREIAALKRISSHCIHLPKVLESGVTVGETFIVFAAQGIPLLYATNKWSKAVRVKKLPLLAHSLSSALNAAHAFGVCHADLRPDNIVVINGVFTLIDFGLSVATGNNILHRRSHSALAFCCDAVVMAHRAPFGNAYQITYSAQYDIECIPFVLYAFYLAKRNLQVPWRLCNVGADMIAKRTSELLLLPR